MRAESKKESEEFAHKLQENSETEHTGIFCEPKAPEYQPLGSSLGLSETLV